MLVQNLISFAQGLKSEVTGQRRNRLFIFREYLDLFKRPIA